MIPYSLNPLGIDRIAELTDLDILRQIRDANPTSQLPSLWLDSEDPYTEWEGVAWQGEKVTSLSFFSKGITNLNGIKKLEQLYFLDCQNNNINSLDVRGTNLASLYAYNAGLHSVYISGLNILQQCDLNNNYLTEIDISGCIGLKTFAIYNNMISAIPTLTTKSQITSYNFRYNNMPTVETNRIIALGFSGAYVLPQNP